MSPRPFSAAGVVATTRGSRLHQAPSPPVRDREGSARRTSLPRPSARSRRTACRACSRPQRGETAIEIGDWTYEVHEDSRRRRSLRRRNLVDAVSLAPTTRIPRAQALARLHLAARDFAAPARKARPLVASFTIFAAGDPVQRNATLSRRAPIARRITTSVARSAQSRLSICSRPFHAELAPFLPALAPLWTHNDLHASNLFWSDAGPRRARHGHHRLRPRRPHQCRARSCPRHRAQHRGVARLVREPPTWRSVPLSPRPSAGAARRLRIGAPSQRTEKPRPSRP